MIALRSFRLLSCFALAAGLLLDVGSSRADAPPGQYVVQSCTVLDTQTKLVWQRDVAPGMYTWAEAKTYCAGLTLAGGGFRVPSIHELQTIVDETKIDPVIDTTAFPGTPSKIFWSSSPLAGDATNAHEVSFHEGAAGYNLVGYANYVRCVR